MLSPANVIALPIDPHIARIVETLRANPSLVLRASPGAGKTTRVPPALLQAFPGEILVLEPRRLAAKLSAMRIAEEQGGRVGDVIGYQFRFENVTGPRTRLRFLTEGMLMRRLLGDPTLARTSVVVLDEFHERHLQGDVALSYLRHLQKGARPDLKIVVMSATLDTEAVAAFLGECPAFTVDAPRFPVTIDYLPAPPAKRIEATVKDAVVSSLKTSDQGDILVFLPGMGEIRACESALRAISGERNIAVHALHGELSREEQDEAIRRGPRRKVILSTNVAETSLTIEGVVFVIDSGLHRLASHSWWSGVPALKTKPISRASAEQRAGRAGRTSPGHCHRLYTKHDFETRPMFEIPEIRRADLAQTLLELKAMKIAQASRFPWFEKPAAGSLESAAELLFRLGALESASLDAVVTEMGSRLAAIPAHPRIARFLVEASRRNVLFEAANYAAELVEGGNVLRTRDQLLGAFPKESRQRKGTDEDLRFSLLTGFPDRVARKRGAELVFSSGGSARADENQVAGADTFAVLEVQEMQHAGQARAQLKVRAVVPIDEGWLFDLEPSAIRETEAMEWDRERERVVGSSRIQYDNLILAETKGEPRDRAEAVRIALKFGLGVKAESLGGMSLSDWLAALGSVSEPEALENAMGKLKLVGIEDRAIGSALERLLSEKGAFVLSALRKTDWPEELVGAFPEHLGTLHRQLPSTIELPSGRKAKVHYPIDKGPWVASRLQDFFGLKKGPSVLGGKIPLTLHLLAPNQRAVQVTSDLAGFWERSYPAIRKELSRKYPRHKWPESPTS